MRKVPPGIQIILSICEEPSRTVASGWNVVEEKSAVISSIAFQWIDRNRIWLGQARREPCHILLDRGPISSGGLAPLWRGVYDGQSGHNFTKGGALYDKKRGQWQDRTSKPAEPDRTKYESLSV